MTLVFKVVLFQVFDDAVHTIGVRSLILGLHSDVHEKIDVYIYIYIYIHTSCFVICFQRCVVPINSQRPELRQRMREHRWSAAQWRAQTESAIRREQLAKWRPCQRLEQGTQRPSPRPPVLRLPSPAPPSSWLRRTSEDLLGVPRES